MILLSIAAILLYNDQSYRSNEHFAEAFVIHHFNAVKLTAGVDLRSSNTDYSAVQKNIFFNPSNPLDRSAYSGDSVKQHQFGIYSALNYSRRIFLLKVVAD